MRTSVLATGAAGLAGAAALGLAHIGPAATWLPPVRNALTPGLAGHGRAGHVALTFDDGPDPISTPLFLDALDDLGVRATFFVLGSRVTRSPEIAAEAAARGHEIAVHGWTHRPQWRPTPTRDVRDLRRTAELVHATCGTTPRWFRPPFGVLTTGLWRAAREAELRPVLWTVWGRDWIEGGSAEAIRRRVAAGVDSGGTVLLHDSSPDGSGEAWRSTLAALPGIVEHCRGEGWTVGPLGEHG